MRRKKSKPTYSIDARGIPTAECPSCGSNLIRCTVIFDTETYEPEMWLLDDAECRECGTTLTAPCPVDHPDYEPEDNNYY